jgi:hypothetical protein
MTLQHRGRPTNISGRWIEKYTGGRSAFLALFDSAEISANHVAVCLPGTLSLNINLPVLYPENYKRPEHPPLSFWNTPIQLDTFAYRLDYGISSSLAASHLASLPQPSSTSSQPYMYKAGCPALHNVDLYYLFRTLHNS